MSCRIVAQLSPAVCGFEKKKQKKDKKERKDPECTVGLAKPQFFGQIISWWNALNVGKVLFIEDGTPRERGFIEKKFVVIKFVLIQRLYNYGHLVPSVAQIRKGSANSVRTLVLAVSQLDLEANIILIFRSFSFSFLTLVQ